MFTERHIHFQVLIKKKKQFNFSEQKRIFLSENTGALKGQ